MSFSKRDFLVSSAATGLLFSARAALGQAPTPRAGADGGGVAPVSDPYPGNYVVKAPAVPPGEPTFVTVREGRLQGVQAGSVRYFRGIPFAAAPVGNLRFKPPRAVQPWQDVRLALENPPASMQNSFLAESGTSEDCLYLNIWAPTAPGPHPVYVYIHGGANNSGYSLEHRVQGASFARDGIVCVNIGYRVGALGFLELGGLLGDEFAGSGNNALRDQLFALQWVQANIAAFGGDPKQVTIGGQSAGGFNVCSLIASPLSQGLFRAAISQSGGGHGVRTLEQARAAADRFAGTLRAQGGNIADLQSMPVQLIMAAQDATGNSSNGGVIDGKVLLQHPYESVRKGRAKNIRVLMGANRDEMVVLGGAPDPARFNEAQKTAYARYQALHAGVPAEVLLVRFAGEQLFGAPTDIFADNHAAAGGAVYVYRWERPADTGKFKGTAFHGIEMPFVWDNIASLAFRYVVPEPKLQPYADAVHRLWVSFIRDGIPGAPGVPPWPAWKPDSRRYLRIADTFQIALRPPEELAVWAGVLAT